jgi:asparagine synthase (glutamine-hydrolysing)
MWHGLQALAHRGPDVKALKQFGSVYFGHARLSILDPDPRSNQPFQQGDIALMYNGELWNYQDLRAQLQKLVRRFKTTGDTEVIVAALLEWGQAAIKRFDGMFALAWTVEGEMIFTGKRLCGMPSPVNCLNRSCAVLKSPFKTV